MRGGEYSGGGKAIRSKVRNRRRMRRGAEARGKSTQKNTLMHWKSNVEYTASGRVILPKSDAAGGDEGEEMMNTERKDGNLKMGGRAERRMRDDKTREGEKKKISEEEWRIDGENRRQFAGAIEKAKRAEPKNRD